MVGEVLRLGGRALSRVLGPVRHVLSGPLRPVGHLRCGVLGGVRSLVGRFLEHARVFYFANDGGEPVVLAGSGDWMPRNFLRRVEVIFPVADPALRAWITAAFFPTELGDTANATILHASGAYLPVPRRRGARPSSAQARFMADAIRRARTPL